MNKLTRTKEHPREMLSRAFERAKTVPCPTCGARAGVDCAFTASDTPEGQQHRTRIAASRTVSNDETSNGH